MKWKSWIEQVLDLAARIDAANEFGALHIVVSDGNMEDEHVEFCLSQPNITPEEAALAEDLLETQEELRFFAYWLSTNKQAQDDLRRAII